MTQAIAINNLTDIVAGLGAIRINLKDILDATSSLEQNVSVLRVGVCSLDAGAFVLNRALSSFPNILTPKDLLDLFD